MIELGKAYDHSKVEDKIYKIWEQSGFFNPDKLPGKRKEPYTIIMPPPNANAPIACGARLGLTIEDILIRYHRMQGKKTLWLPGSDHAGFETQVVFEKKLEKEGRSRFKMQREEFYKEIWDYVQTNKHISEHGHKTARCLLRLGAEHFYPGPGNRKSRLPDFQTNVRRRANLPRPDAWATGAASTRQRCLTWKPNTKSGTEPLLLSKIRPVCYFHLSPRNQIRRQVCDYAPR